MTGKANKTMTNFERIGANLQYLSRDEREATVNFMHSCECCCRSPRAMHNSCDHCAIEAAHRMMLAKFADAAREPENYTGTAYIETKEVDIND